jgi:hypothetical protein
VTHSNGVLRRIFGPDRDEVVAGSRKLHIEKLDNLNSSRRRRWAGNVAHMGRRNVEGFGEKKPEGKRLLGKPRRSFFYFLGVG